MIDHPAQVLKILIKPMSETMSEILKFINYKVMLCEAVSKVGQTMSRNF